MKLLAIDTSSAVLSVAAVNGKKTACRLEIRPRQHAEQLFRFVDQVLADTNLELAQLGAIACGVGPGSFTSLRIGLGAVQGLALGAELPVIPVSSLLAVAQAQLSADRVLVCMDARMGEVYSAFCERGSDGLFRLRGPERVCVPEAVTLPADDNWLAAGTGFGEYGDRFARQPPEIATDGLPLAGAILELAAPRLRDGEWIDAACLIPHYVRDNVATKPANQPSR